MTKNSIRCLHLLSLFVVLFFLGIIQSYLFQVMTANHSGTMFSIIDSRMGSYPSECLERFAALALSCCDEKTERRPSMLAVVRELENLLKMMPESDTVVSESTSTFSGLSTTQSSSFMASSSLVSSSMSGSDLVSGVIPTITPR